jgi:hypothetical protein
MFVTFLFLIQNNADIILTDVSQTKKEVNY